MIAALARPPLARLVRSPRAVAALVAWTGLGLALSRAARVAGASSSADHALLGVFGAVVAPLLAYTLVGGVLGGRSLRGSVAPVVALGATPVRAAAASLAVAIGGSSALLALVGALVAAIAHGPGDPPVAGDALTSAYAGALGGAAYAAFFALGATFGRRGGARPLVLVADWLLGSGAGPVALVMPRAHLRNLLGGLPPGGLGERVSALVLVGMVLLAAGLALRRSR